MDQATRGLLVSDGDCIRISVGFPFFYDSTDPIAVTNVGSDRPSRKGQLSLHGETSLPSDIASLLDLAESSTATSSFFPLPSVFCNLPARPPESDTVALPEIRQRLLHRERVLPAVRARQPALPVVTTLEYDGGALRLQNAVADLQVPEVTTVRRALAALIEKAAFTPPGDVEIVYRVSLCIA